MIETGLVFYEEEILLMTNKQETEEKSEKIIKSALSELNKKSISKVIQIGKIRLGIK
jgi:hypothetical protein